MGAAASAMASSTIPEIFFKQDGGDGPGIPALDRLPLEKERDQRVGDVDCYVVTSVTDPAKSPGQGAWPEGGGKLGTSTTLWIGKRDHLIHQARTSMAGASFTETHENIVVNPDDLSPYFER
jgi:hypothetical protein